MGWELPSDDLVVDTKPATNGQVLTATSATRAGWATPSGGGSTLTPTAVKSGNYTAAAGDLVPVDISAGSFTITLPTAPADKSQVCVEVIARNTAGAPKYATVACGGSDVLFAAGGSTSGIIGRGSIILQYASASAIWYAPGTGDFLPTGWEFGHDQITAPVSLVSTTEASATAIITCAAHVFDGSPVVATVSADYMGYGASANGSACLCLFDSATEVARLHYALQPTANTTVGPVTRTVRFTPTAGSHSFILSGFSIGAGVVTFGAGASGTAAQSAGSIRFTKA